MSRWLILCLYWHHSGAIISVISDISQHKESSGIIPHPLAAPHASPLCSDKMTIFLEIQSMQNICLILCKSSGPTEMDTHYQNQYEICIHHSGSLNQSKFRFNNFSTPELGLWGALWMCSRSGRCILKYKRCDRGFVSRHLSPLCNCRIWDIKCPTFIRFPSYVSIITHIPGDRPPCHHWLQHLLWPGLWLVTKLCPSLWLAADWCCCMPECRHSHSSDDNPSLWSNSLDQISRNN